MVKSNNNTCFEVKKTKKGINETFWWPENH